MIGYLVVIKKKIDKFWCKNKQVGIIKDVLKLKGSKPEKSIYKCVIGLGAWKGDVWHGHIGVAGGTKGPGKWRLVRQDVGSTWVSSQEFKVRPVSNFTYIAME